jgi:3-phenylpropionate/trans-cinnamate dioxygenase ferredoxin subunit
MENTMTAPTSFQRVLPAAELPAGARKPLVVEGKPLLLCNAGGALYAIANQCSHNDKPLERGRIGNGWIACPTHGARFDLATGKAMCLPATQPIATYEVRVVDEWIEVLVSA